MILIAAIDDSMGIAKQGKTPWHLPADLAYFRHQTLGHRLLMGRKTAEAIGRPLEGRESIVFSTKSMVPAGFLHARSLGDFFARFGAEEPDKLTFVAGGENIYRLFLPFADKLIITHVHGDYDCDKFFPDIDPQEWAPSKIVYSHKADSKNEADFDIRIYYRR
ncbi:dihydrofolate reductase [candidate division KSB3 bacterium]|uniref:dihydrofolate reductase n=1 Tax=candidate division KSB3 bacterium TaxID=2044937 RepID=A0A2G6E056_9BACT|nr:MAG: dihydrofolate reductase [candidate division KSB3 bacterium]